MPHRDYLLTVGLFIVGLVCAAIFVVFDIRNNHSSFFYVAATYGLLLPLLIVYLRRRDPIVSVGSYEIPPVHIVICTAAIVTALILCGVLANGRLISDDLAYCFQAKIFASGHIAALPMPGASADAAARPPEIYFEHNIQAAWGWFTKYPPGWPAMLAIGYWLHIPWLLNPILAALQLLCVWNLARSFGRLVQVLALTFIASSMYYLMWSISYMSHAFETTLALLALIAVMKSINDNSTRWLVVTFALVFATTQVRPFTGAVIGAVCAAIALLGFRRRRRMLMTAVCVIGTSAALSAAAILFYNWTYTGDMRLSPYAALHGRRDVEEISFRLREVLDNIANTTRWGLIDTAATTFPFLFLLAAYAVVREKEQRFKVVSLSLLFPALVLAHIIVILPSGGYNGQRYYYEGFAALAIVAARGCQLLIAQWNISRNRLLTAMTVLLVLQVVRCVMGIRTVMIAERPYIAMYEIAHKLQAPLVFVHDSTPVFTAKHTNWNDVEWASASKVYLVDPGPERREQVACRFNRPEWSVVSYDPVSRTVSSTNGRAVCVGQTPPPVPRRST